MQESRASAGDLAKHCWILEETHSLMSPMFTQKYGDYAEKSAAFFALLIDRLIHSCRASDAGESDTMSESAEVLDALDVGSPNFIGRQRNFPSRSPTLSPKTPTRQSNGSS